MIAADLWGELWKIGLLLLIWGSLLFLPVAVWARRNVVSHQPRYYDRQFVKWLHRDLEPPPPEIDWEMFEIRLPYHLGKPDFDMGFVVRISTVGHPSQVDFRARSDREKYGICSGGCGCLVCKYRRSPRPSRDYGKSGG